MFILTEWPPTGPTPAQVDWNELRLKAKANIVYIGPATGPIVSSLANDTPTNIFLNYGASHVIWPQFSTGDLRPIPLTLTLYQFYFDQYTKYNTERGDKNVCIVLLHRNGWGD